MPIDFREKSLDRVNKGKSKAKVHAKTKPAEERVSAT